MKMKHLHRYKLKDLNRKTNVPYYVYICTKQECTHNIRVELVEGKLAECNRCGEPFEMRLARLKHGDRLVVKPICKECVKTPERVKKQKNKGMEKSIDSLLASVLPKG